MSIQKTPIHQIESPSVSGTKFVKYNQTTGKNEWSPINASDVNFGDSMPLTMDSNILRWWHLGGATTHSNTINDFVKGISNLLSTEDKNFIRSSTNIFSGVGDYFYSLGATSVYCNVDTLIDGYVDGDDAVALFVDGRPLAAYLGNHGSDNVGYQYPNAKGRNTTSYWPTGYRLTKGWHTFTVLHTEITGSDTATAFIRATPATPEVAGSGTNTGWVSLQTAHTLGFIGAAREVSPVLAFNEILCIHLGTGLSAMLPSFNADMVDGLHASSFVRSDMSVGQNSVLAGPTSGSGNPSFRTLVATDIPSLNYLPLTGGELSNTLTGTAGTFDTISVNKGLTSTSGNGISLYGGTTTGMPVYGITFTGTSLGGTHGSVNGGWATYLTMSADSNRGWIFRSGTTNVASISGLGNAKFDGTLRVLGATTLSETLFVSSMVTLGSSLEFADNGNVGIRNTSNTSWMRPQDASGNMHLKVTDAAKGIYHDAKAHYFRDNSGGTSNNTALTVYGDATATRFIRSGGTSSQFLKGDGSVDSTEYAGLDRLGATTTSGVLDWSDGSNTRPGTSATLLLGSYANGPTPGVNTYFHSFNLEYGSKTGAGNVTQLAIPYGTSSDRTIYMRGRYNGTWWSSWVKLWTNDNLTQANGSTSGWLSSADWNTFNNKTSNTGTVTSVGMTVPSILSVTPASITTSGTFAVSLASQTANTVFAAPNGSSGAPSFRALVAADIPALNYVPTTYLTSRSIMNANDVDAVGLSAHYTPSGATNRPTGTDHGILTMKHSTNWSVQLAGDWRTNEWYVRTQNNGTWGATWSKLWHSGNSNLSTVDWAAKILTTSSDANIQGLTVGRGGGNEGNSTAVGMFALMANTTGFGNTAVGRESLRFTTTGMHNIAVGLLSLFSNTTGNFNIAIGNNALYNSTSSNSVAIGYEALKTITTGNNNVAVGHRAGSLSTGSGNVAVGIESLMNSTSNGNTALGAYTLRNSGLGNANTAIGYASMLETTTGYYNVSVGYEALRQNTTGANNVAIGFQASYLNVTGVNNTAIGGYAMLNSTGSNVGVAVGYEALRYNTTGSALTAVGSWALSKNTTGTYSTAVGYQALFENTSAIHNTALGYYSLANTTTGGYNTAVGGGALGNSNAANNVAVGFEAMRFESSGGNNVALGWRSAYNTTTGGVNVFVGSQVAYDNTTGQRNTIIGYNSGRGITTGSYNTIIGANVIGLSPTLNQTIILADGAGNIRYWSTTTGTGIGTTTPAYPLDVNGVIGATGGNSTNWNTAFGWGNHASAGYWSSTSMGGIERASGTGTDLNTTGSGLIHQYGTTSAWLNMPVSSYGHALTLNASINMSQFYMDIRHGQTDFGDLYFRTKNTSGWATWRKIWHSGNLLQANASTSGWLSSADWNTFNNKTSNTGTVTSVGMTVPSILSVTPASITTSGTFAVSLASQTANTVFAAPNGSSGAPSFRALVAADIPALSYASGTGTVNTIPKWSNGTGGLANSSITDTGSLVTIGSATTISGAATITGAASITGNVTLNTNTIIRDNGDGATVISQNGGTPAIYLRPGGDGSTTNQLYLSPTQFTVGGKNVAMSNGTTTANVIPKFSNGVAELAGSSISDNGTTVTVSAGLEVNSTQNFRTVGNNPQFLTGSGDHVYLQFYARTATPWTRSAWIGYGSGGTTLLTLHNEIGNINLATSNNVGIGQTSPAFKLDVGGTLRATGAAQFDSTVTGTRLISTQATGTAPLTVTSTTLVSNLNAEMVGGFKVESAQGKAWGFIPVVKSDGVMEMGRYIDFTHTSNSSADYHVRLSTDGVSNSDLYINSNAIYHAGNMNRSTVDFSARNLNLIGKAVIEATNNDDPAIIELNTRYASENWRARIISDYYGGKYATAVQHGMSFIGGRAGFENFRWFTNALVEHMTLSKDGNLTVKGNITSNSDARLKTNIEDYKNGIETVLKLRPVTFDWVDRDIKGDFGFIADEVKETLPSVVLEGDDSNKTLSMDYGRVTAVLTKAVQEQQDIINKQSATIEELMNRLEQLENRLK